MLIPEVDKKSLLILICFVVCVLSLEAEKEVPKSYASYLRSYQKDPKRNDDISRRALFQKSVEFVQEHNARVASLARQTFSLRVNQFSDWTEEEMSAIFPDITDNKADNSQHLLQQLLSNDASSLLRRRLYDAPPPVSVNWADVVGNPTGQRVVSPVGDQALCGACWAFSAVYATEASVRIAGQPVSLSVQELVDCDQNGTVGMIVSPMSINKGCSGGNPIRAFGYILKYGLAGWKWPSKFSKQVQQCTIDSKQFSRRENILATHRGASPPHISDSSTPEESQLDNTATLSESPPVFPSLASFDSFVVIPSGDETMIRDYVGRVGPVTIGICGTDPRFIFYGKGILDIDDCCTTLNHALLIVGYGTEAGMDYWIAQNSWGTQWGEEGFIRIKRTQNKQPMAFFRHFNFFQSPPGVCGMALSASLPLGGFLLSPSTDSSVSIISPSDDDVSAIFSKVSDWFQSNEKNIALVLSGILLTLAVVTFLAALQQDNALWQQRTQRFQQQRINTQDNESIPPPRTEQSPLLGPAT